MQSLFSCQLNKQAVNANVRRKVMIGMPLNTIIHTPNGTVYPRYLVQGLHSLRESVEEKVQSIYHKKVTEVDEKRKVAVFDWEERHPDIKLNHDLTCMYRTWPFPLLKISFVSSGSGNVLSLSF